ncbi:hypothetical protein [Cellulomonas sp. 179-A 9B4 NHS]|uniref:hypothetical protein n=1 Tax=Cellulomonas sp. 179-A 9B4 NHS TaxID=3142379 RepID=UPI0039A2DAA3
MVRRRAVALLAVLLAPVVLGACTPAASVEEHERSREEVRAAAAEVIPALADALGGEVRWARGEYEAYGLKDDLTLAYQADADITVVTTRDDVAAAVTGLDWTVDDDAGDGPSVVGERGDLTLRATVREDHVQLSVDGPRLGVGDERPERNGQEGLGLPYPTFVPYESPGATPSPSDDAEG